MKLDRSLVSGIHADPAREALVTGLVHFARIAGPTVIAEGIETAAEAEAVARLGIQLGQGFLHGRPSAAATHRAVNAESDEPRS